MKTATEMRDAAGKTMHTIADTSRKAAYAAVGAPVAAGKRIAGYTGKVRKTAQSTFEAWIAEGERVTTQLVEEIKERVDFEQLQGRVEKLRDQLEDVLSNWRESFKPEKAEKASEETVSKPASKKSTAKKAKDEVADDTPA
jgi:NADH dehydrogenase/NADH:ubiquinone oxidoreductase subunit G